MLVVLTSHYLVVSPGFKKHNYKQINLKNVEILSHQDVPVLTTWLLGMAMVGGEVFVLLYAGSHISKLN